MEHITLSYSTLFTAIAGLVAVVVFAIRSEGRTNGHAAALRRLEQDLLGMEKDHAAMRESYIRLQAKSEATEEFLSKVENKLTNIESLLLNGRPMPIPNK